MTQEDAQVASTTEIHAVEAPQNVSSSSRTNDVVDASGLRMPPTLTRVFNESLLRRPSKIPRLATQPSSVVGSATAGESFRSKMATPSSATSSRETTPFTSPTRPSSRLRGPTQIVSRKRPRDDATSATIASVAERLRLHSQRRHVPSEELSVATTQDDTASQASVCREDGAEALAVEAAPSKDNGRGQGENEPTLEQQATVAKALQLELLRDRARLRLKISAMKEDVETYYEILARMEQVTVAVMARHAETKGENSKSVLQLAERIQSIISARKTEGDGGQGHSTREDHENGQKGHADEVAHNRIELSSNTLADEPHDEEVVEEY